MPITDLNLNDIPEAARSIIRGLKPGDEIKIGSDEEPIGRLTPLTPRVGKLKGLMEPVSDEEWEQADEAIRANWNPYAMWLGEE